MSLSSHRVFTRVLAPLIGVVLPLSAQPASTAAKPRPDLKVTKLAVSPAKLLAGGTLRITETTANVGRSKAKPTSTRYYLSANKTYDKRDLLLGARKVGALKNGASQRGEVRLRVPTTTKARTYYVVACADGARKVRESREGNNCRATGKPITVREPDVGPEPEPNFPMEPNPLTVDSTLQTDRAATVNAATHTATTLTATAADGTTYTLEIPQEALLGVEKITMTPVAAMPDLPLSGGLVAGVQLEPHGLMLLKPATLTITSPDAGPLAAQTAFLSHEDGEDFHLYPMNRPRAGDDANTVRMDLTHFSTPGLGSGTAADRSAARARVPARTIAQVESVNAEALRAERQSVESGNPPDPEVMTEVLSVLDQYFDQVVRPRLQAAEMDPDLAATAIAEALGWSRQGQLLGDEDNPRHAEVMERVERILRNAMSHHFDDCTSQNDLRTIPLLQGIARAAAMFGWEWAAEAMDKLERCGNFEVSFDSRIMLSDSYTGTLQSGSVEGLWHTTSTIEVPFLAFQTPGLLEYAEFSYFSTNTIHDSDPDCTSTTVGTTTTPGRLRATATPIYQVDARDDGDESTTDAPPPPSVVVSVTLDATARPREGYRRTPCNGPDSVVEDTRWSSFHGSLRGVTRFTSNPDEQAGDLIGTEFWSDQDAWGDSRAETTLEIRHEPLS